MTENLGSTLGIGPSTQGDPYPPVAPHSNSPYYGYSGWLAFFCVVQIFIVPVFVLISCAMDVSALGSSNYNLDEFVVLEILGLLGLGAYAVYTGLKLRRLRPGAVRTAKTYLVVGLLWAVLRVFLALLMLEGETRDAVGFEEVKGLFQSIISFAIWFSYFNVSKRIKATFPETSSDLNLAPPKG